MRTEGGNSASSRLQQREQRVEGDRVETASAPNHGADRKHDLDGGDFGERHLSVWDDWNRQRGRGGSRFGGRFGAIAIREGYALIITPSQFATQPMEVALLETLAFALSPDGQPMKGLVGDPPSPELFLGRIAMFSR